MTGELRAAGGSVEKAFALIAELVSQRGPSRLGDLAERTGMTKPTAHRLLRSLAAMGYVRARGSGEYGVGAALLGVAAAALGGVEERPLIRQTLDEVHRRTGLTASFAIRSRDSAVVIDNVEPDQAYRVSPRLGVPSPLRECAAGLAMLAGQDDSAMDDAAADGDARARLARFRALGYAYDDAEPAPAVRSLAAAVRPSGQVTGALVLTGLSFTLNAESIDVLGPLLAEHAHVLSVKLEAMLPDHGAEGIA